MQAFYELFPTSRKKVRQKRHKKASKPFTSSIVITYISHSVLIYKSKYYIDVINQQINSFTGYETERQNIINGTTEIQDALNNRKAYQNVLSYLEKAQEANRNGDDESLQTYIDIVKQQINSFTGYETERENILNKVNILQKVKNNRHNYSLLLEYYHNAVDSYNNGEDKQTIQYYIDVTKQQLNRVDNYETEKSNIEKSIQELQEKVNNM